MKSFLLSLFLILGAVTSAQATCSDVWCDPDSTITLPTGDSARWFAPANCKVYEPYIDGESAPYYNADTSTTTEDSEVVDYLPASYGLKSPDNDTWVTMICPVLPDYVNNDAEMTALHILAVNDSNVDIEAKIGLLAWNATSFSWVALGGSRDVPGLTESNAVVDGTSYRWSLPIVSTSTYRFLTPEYRAYGLMVSIRGGAVKLAGLTQDVAATTPIPSRIIMDAGSCAAGSYIDGTATELMPTSGSAVLAESDDSPAPGEELFNKGLCGISVPTPVTIDDFDVGTMISALFGNQAIVNFTSLTELYWKTVDSVSEIANYSVSEGDGIFGSFWHTYDPSDDQFGVATFNVHFSSYANASWKRDIVVLPAAMHKKAWTAGVYDVLGDSDNKYTVRGGNFMTYPIHVPANTGATIVGINQSVTDDGVALSTYSAIYKVGPDTGVGGNLVGCSVTSPNTAGSITTGSVCNVAIENGYDYYIKTNGTPGARVNSIKVLID